MASYLGPLGGLVPVRCASSLQTSTARPVSLRTTLGGRRMAQVGRRAHRSWDVGLSAASTPSDLAPVQAFVDGEHGVGPWWWIDAWSQVTNLLPPGAAALEPPWNNTVIGPPVSLPDGSRAGRSLQFINPATVSYMRDLDGAILRIPCAPALPVTVAAWLNTPGAVLVVAVTDAAGTQLTAPQVAHTALGWARDKVTFTPPATAAGLSIRVLGGGSFAHPTVTWTPTLMAYHAGQGAPQVIVTEFSQDVTLATTKPGRQMAEGSYTVTEVG